ncbi:MAG TPA: enoyl-CoA hydratase-related protein [Steroidobacteraceae bacterium]|nr:enoyl-CoA hydratase-related protein [Steroidobacteraceae bacterium]
MNSAVVLFEARGTAAIVTINRPERRNALNAEVAEGIIAALDRAEGEPAFRSVVLTGAGDRAFCAGGDLSKDRAGTPFEVNFSDPRNFVVSLLRRITDCRLPVVARVNGPALAGGFGLLCACDMAVALETATFGTPESRIGIFPMMILPHMLRVIPVRPLMEMCICGEPIDAAQALQMGLVNHVVPAAELDAKVDWLCKRIERSSPTGIRLGKTALAAMRDMTLEQSLEYAQVMLQSMSSTDEAAEGFRSFQEKRSPAWVSARPK